MKVLFLTVACATFALLQSTSCPGGGIGRRARLKLAFRKECGFDSHPGYTTRGHRKTASRFFVFHSTIDSPSSTGCSLDLLVFDESWFCVHMMAI